MLAVTAGQAGDALAVAMAITVVVVAAVPVVAAVGAHGDVGAEMILHLKRVVSVSGRHAFGCSATLISSDHVRTTLVARL